MWVTQVSFCCRFRPSPIGAKDNSPGQRNNVTAALGNRAPNIPLPPWERGKVAEGRMGVGFDYANQNAQQPSGADSSIEKKYTNLKAAVSI
jgi:hypothetical protein